MKTKEGSAQCLAPLTSPPRRRTRFQKHRKNNARTHTHNNARLAFFRVVRPAARSSPSSSSFRSSLHSHSRSLVMSTPRTTRSAAAASAPSPSPKAAAEETENACPNNSGGKVRGLFEKKKKTPTTTTTGEEPETTTSERVDDPPYSPLPPNVVTTPSRASNRAARMFKL